MSRSQVIRQPPIFVTGGWREIQEALAHWARSLQYDWDYISYSPDAPIFVSQAESRKQPCIIGSAHFGQPLNRIWQLTKGQQHLIVLQTDPFLLTADRYQNGEYIQSYETLHVTGLGALLSNLYG